MRKWLNTYFELSKREFNGLLTLVVVIFLVSICPWVYHYIYPAPENVLLEQEALKMLAAVNKYAPMKAVSADPDPKDSRHEPVLFYFDPNTIGAEEWQKLGLTYRQAQSVMKYTTKGGRFHKKEDLQKMYTIENTLYKRLAPYIRIRKSAEDRDQNDVSYNQDLSFYTYKSNVTTNRSGSEQVNRLIEVNQADTSLLDEIHGIGAVFARRIVKYRERLGGFDRKEQLMEVYGLDSNKYAEIKDQIQVNPSFIKKIDINTAKFEDLKDHPYLRYKQVNAILQYRAQHGNYVRIEDLSKIAILEPGTIEKLAPYLIF